MQRLAVLVGILAVGLAFCACGDDEDDVVPAEDLPDDALLVDLTNAEFSGLCDWAGELARERFMSDAGSGCEGQPVRFDGCMRVNERCTATVGEWKACQPDLVERFAEEPCAAIEVDTSEEFAAFIEAIPSCEGLGHCANTAH